LGPGGIRSVVAESVLIKQQLLILNRSRFSIAGIVERLIGTVRREYLDRTLFWTTIDLENKLPEFRDYFNSYRTHHSLEGQTPDRREPRPVANLTSYRWQPHCRGLYQTPIAA